MTWQDEQGPRCCSAASAARGTLFAECCLACHVLPAHSQRTDSEKDTATTLVCSAHPVTTHRHLALHSALLAQKAIQTKTFTKWMNAHLKDSGVELTSVTEDLKTGVHLHALLEKLTEEKFVRAIHSFPRKPPPPLSLFSLFPSTHAFAWLLFESVL